MPKSKDPEVVDEMRAAGRKPDIDGPRESADIEKLAADSDSRGSAKSSAAAKDNDKVAAAQSSAAEGRDDRPEDGLVDLRDDILGARSDGKGSQRSGKLAEDHDEPEYAAAEVEGTDHPGIHDELHFPQSPDHHADLHPDEHGHRSMAATALMYLVGAIAIASATLWAAPRVAPHVPASIGQYLMPGQLHTGAEIEALRQQLADQAAQSEARVTKLQTRLDATSARLDALPDPAAAASNAAEALDLARSAGAQAAALKTQSEAIATELAGLRQSVGAVNAALSGADGTAAPANLAAAVAGMNARIENLTQTTATRADLNALSARIDALEASAATASAAQNQALGEVSAAIRQASLRSAVAALTSHVEGGQPYAAPLGEIEALTGASAPPALATAAATGLATPAALGASFGPRAQAAISADVQARAGEGASSQVLGWLRAQVTGRPTSEQAGDDVAATTSRIAARIREGALAEALAEAESMPPPAQSALGPWLDRLRARVQAGAALSAWLTEIGVNG